MPHKTKRYATLRYHTVLSERARSIKNEKQRQTMTDATCVQATRERAGIKVYATCTLGVKKIQNAMLREENNADLCEGYSRRVSIQFFSAFVGREREVGKWKTKDIQDAAETPTLCSKVKPSTHLFLEP